MGFKRILVLTFKPAVESAWHEDLQTHVDFDGWQFISNKDAHNNKIDIDRAYRNADKSKPIVVFGSFQDLLGTNENGGIKAKKAENNIPRQNLRLDKIRWTTMKTHAPFAAAAERQSKPMITTHLMVTFFAMNATAAKQSPASIAVTESGQMTSRCRYRARQ